MLVITLRYPIEDIDSCEISYGGDLISAIRQERDNPGELSCKIFLGGE
jgi:hypothetical protein